MTTLFVQSPQLPLSITWEKLPADFVLPDESVDDNLQPLLAAALRESLELAGLILESVIIATNFGICATVDFKSPHLRNFSSPTSSIRGLSSGRWQVSACSTRSKQPFLD